MTERCKEILEKILTLPEEDILWIAVELMKTLPEYKIHFDDIED